MNNTEYDQEIAELKEVIKGLLNYITLPDEPIYNTAVMISYEQGLRNALADIQAKRSLVYRAREIVKTR